MKEKIINIKFHDDINYINYEYLIENNMNKIAEIYTGIKYMLQTKKKMNFLKYINYLLYFQKV